MLLFGYTNCGSTTEFTSIRTPQSWLLRSTDAAHQKMHATIVAVAILDEPSFSPAIPFIRRRPDISICGKTKRTTTVKRHDRCETYIAIAHPCFYTLILSLLYRSFFPRHPAIFYRQQNEQLQYRHYVLLLCRTRRKLGLKHASESLSVSASPERH